MTRPRIAAADTRLSKLADRIGALEACIQELRRAAEILDVDTEAAKVALCKAVDKSFALLPPTSIARTEDSAEPRKRNGDAGRGDRIDRLERYPLLEPPESRKPFRAEIFVCDDKATLKASLTRSGWRWPARFDGFSCIRLRESLWDISQSSRVVGQISIKEWHIDSFADEDEVKAAFDTIDLRTSDFGEMLVENCADGGPLVLLGTIVEYHSAWVEPTFANGRLWPELNRRLFNEFYADPLVLLAKACPLEFDYVDELTPAGEAKFERRQAAMKRYYKGLSGMTPVRLARWANEGWLWLWSNPHDRRHYSRGPKDIDPAI